MNSGWAIGKTGHPYRNSASWDSGSKTPLTGTTGHRLELIEDLTAQTVRLVDNASADINSGALTVFDARSDGKCDI